MDTVNQNIKNALLDLRKSTKPGVGGHQFEEEVYKIFRKHLKIKNETNIVCRVAISNGQPVNGVKRKQRDNTLVSDDGLHLVPQPNGSQSWPDFLIVNKGSVMCFEIKSGKGGKITWNSGFPKENCIYIYKDMTDNRVYYFHGRDRISGSASVVNELKNMFERQLKEDAKRLYNNSLYNPLRNNNITHYARSMWMDKTNYSRHENADVWTKNVYNFIESFKW